MFDANSIYTTSYECALLPTVWFQNYFHVIDRSHQGSLVALTQSTLYSYSCFRALTGLWHLSLVESRTRISWNINLKKSVVLVGLLERVEGKHKGD